MVSWVSARGSEWVGRVSRISHRWRNAPPGDGVGGETAEAHAVGAEGHRAAPLDLPKPGRRFQIRFASRRSEGGRKLGSGRLTQHLKRGALLRDVERVVV